mmetsp:Transcript_46946/g.105242  ORF Transcript_46946/g.105242 Transcript_46946/m.105242 type:complete len:535 (+) Transcript_46946:72-1676(+)
MKGYPSASDYGPTLAPRREQSTRSPEIGTIGRGQQPSVSQTGQPRRASPLADSHRGGQQSPQYREGCPQADVRHDGNGMLHELSVHGRPSATNNMQSPLAGDRPRSLQAPANRVGLGASAAPGSRGARPSAGVGMRPTVGNSADPYLLSPSFETATPQVDHSDDARRALELEVRVHELEARNKELEDKTRELDAKLDHDGEQFLDALSVMEAEIEELKGQNTKLLEEKSDMEEKLRLGGSDMDIREKCLRLERERKEVIAQVDEFQRDKEEELGSLRRELDEMTRRLNQQEVDFKRKIADMEAAKENLLETMAEEGNELQSRIEKLSQDKESLGKQLAAAKALAEEGSLFAGGRPPPTQDANELRATREECEALRDKVAANEGELLRLRDQLASERNKLELSDMENKLLLQKQATMRAGSSAASPTGPSSCSQKPLLGQAATKAAAPGGTTSAAAAALAAQGVTPIGGGPGSSWPKRIGPGSARPGASEALTRPPISSSQASTGLGINSRLGALSARPLAAQGASCGGSERAGQ